MIRIQVWMQRIYEDKQSEVLCHRFIDGSQRFSPW
jgi:hypothetical protein